MLPRDENVPGSILRFLPEITQTRLYYAVVERLAGREDAHIKDWAEFDVCLVPKKGDISYIDRWRPISLVPTLYKLYEICMWKVLDKELKKAFRVSCLGSDRVDNAWT